MQKFMRENVSLEDAQNLLLNISKPMGEEKISIDEALNRIIAQDIIAKENIPHFARSAYDGYAFKAGDTRVASKDQPVVLQVLEEIPAGYQPVKEIVSGTASKVMTGAPIPQGADTVINYEVTERVGSELSLFATYKVGANIIPAGEDIKKGQLVAAKGAMITPPVIGLLASLGISEVPVFKKPFVSVVSTGDELINIDEPLKPAKIRNSNAYSLQAYLQDLGAAARIVGTAKDRVGEVKDYIVRGLAEAEMVITTGGISVGDYDVVEEALAALGAELVFRQIEIKPGSPTLAAIKDGKVILCLSGNPASALVVFQLLGAPVIRKMSGKTGYLADKISVELMEPFPKKSPKRRFLRGILILEGGKVGVKLTGAQGNSVLSSMVGCNLLVDVPAGSGSLAIGTRLIANLVE